MCWHAAFYGPGSYRSILLSDLLGARLCILSRPTMGLGPPSQQLHWQTLLSLPDPSKRLAMSRRNCWQLGWLCQGLIASKLGAQV
jgi:hypothetical protein